MEKTLFNDEVSDKKRNLLQRVREQVKANEPIDEKLELDLCTASKDELSWEIFYALLDSQYEQENGYWISAKVATTLLGPAIGRQFNKNQNARILESVGEDFTSETLLEIRRVIPNFKREISEFPNFIGLYLKQVGYVHNKDASAYEMKKTGIRIFSQNAIVNSGPQAPAAIDPYFNTASEFDIQEEIENRNKQMRASAFQDIVINKKYSSEAHKEIRTQAKDIYEAKASAHSVINNIETKEERESIKENFETVFGSKEIEQVLREDDINTKINVAFWAKFLGGVAHYDDFFVEKMKETISKLEDDDRDASEVNHE